MADLTHIPDARRSAAAAVQPIPNRPLKILMLEDVDTDFELVKAELRRGGLQYEAARAEDGEQFAALLDDFAPDVILADYSLPQFNALEALELLRQRHLNLPFVLVTGTQTEEIAVQCIKMGADDYILKERLARLPSAVVKAIASKTTEHEKEKALFALQQSEKRYRLITENTRDLICLLDESGEALYMSPSSRALTGFPPQQLIEATDVWSLPTQEQPGGVATLLQTLETPGRPIQIQARHRNGEKRTFEGIGQWVNDHKPRSAVIVLRDITARKQAEAELHSTQLQLIQSEKMELVGRLAAGVAHEVKNPLTVVLMGVDYLSRHIDNPSADTTTLLADMEASARKANDVIHELLDFATPGGLQKQRGDIAAIIDNALGILKHQFTKGQIQVIRNTGAEIPMLWLDANKVDQVFVNLFLNAIHAMPEGGRLTVNTYGEDESRVVVEIDDSGKGITDDQLGKVFDPFFTTKPTGQGTGLGLTIVQKIVELHGGSISLHNKPEGGVLARLTFPLEGSH